MRYHVEETKAYVNANIGHLCNISHGYTYKAKTNRVSLSFAYVSRALCQVLTGILFEFGLVKLFFCVCFCFVIS